MAAGVFRLSQCWRAEEGPALRLVQLLSRASFCIYLGPPLFQWLLAQYSVDFKVLPTVWAVPAQAGVLLVLSLAVYLVLRRIPWVNAWLI